jgi:hypothetical protein
MENQSLFFSDIPAGDEKIANLLYSDFPVPGREVTNQPDSPWLGIIKIFPARGCLVSDVPAEDGKISNLFLQCNYFIFTVRQEW